MQKSEAPQYSGIVLGSMKPETWHIFRPHVEILQAQGVSILFPKDLGLTSLALPDNPGFFYFQSDLEEVGLSLEQIEGLPKHEVAQLLKFRNLERKLLKNLLTHKNNDNCLTYTVTSHGRLGKSTGYELLLAALFDNKLALNSPVTHISNQIGRESSEVIASILPEIPILPVETIASIPDLGQHFSRVKGDGVEGKRLQLMRDSLKTLLRQTVSYPARSESEYREI